jgi:gamma-butyrobetaine dioxygenase
MPWPGDLPASWLRANCQCGSCLDPGSGQRLVSITELPDRTEVTAVRHEGDAVQVTFGPDGHEGTFSGSWLAMASQGGPAPRTEDAKRLWAAADFPDGPPDRRWPRFLADPPYRADCLEAVLTCGFVVLRDVPATPGSVLAVAQSMGFVRETNYGRLFDVRTVVDPANLAFSALAIAPHTDNPYRDPVPTVQLLHCLASAAEGGDSGLVDGFAAASLLRAEQPGAFSVLTQTPVTFGYADATAELTATAPMIGLDARSRVTQIRFNNRSLRPLALSGPIGADAFYRSYRAFAAILSRPELMLTFRLAPGDCLVFDNTRILHARTAFSGHGAGHRHLQGCYADLDGVESTVGVLRRRIRSADQDQLA